MSASTSTPWLDGLTIPQVLDRTLEQFAQRDALVFPRFSLRWNYRQFGEQIDQAARGLVALGIHRGQHVAIWATNVPEWVVLQFATARIGAVLVTINPAYRAHELKYVLRQSDAAILVLTDAYKTSDYFAMLGDVCPEINRSATVDATSCSQSLHAPTTSPNSAMLLPSKAPPLQARSLGNRCSRSAIPFRHPAYPIRRRPIKTQRSHQHPIHFRHNRLSQGRDAQPSQSAA